MNIMPAFENATLKQLIQPTYWPLWLAMPILKGIMLLPYRLQLAIGRSIGRFLQKILKKQRKIALAHFMHCFPHLSEQQRQQLLKKNFESTGQGLIELAMSGYMSDRRFKKLFTIEGIEHLEAAKKLNHGIIFVSNHSHILPIMGRILAGVTPFRAVMRPQRNRLFNDRFNYHCAKYGVDLIHRHGVHTMAECLETGNSMLYLPDQDYGARHSVFAPFFGVAAASTTALPRLAKLTNAIVMPVFCYRKPNNQGYVLKIAPVLPNYPDDDIMTAVRRINAVMENAIAVQPEDYLWIYKRFRTRPEGEESIY